MQICGRCGKTKDENLFSLGQLSRPEGFVRYCRECTAERYGVKYGGQADARKKFSAAYDALSGALNAHKLAVKQEWEQEVKRLLDMRRIRLAGQYENKQK